MISRRRPERVVTGVCDRDHSRSCETSACIDCPETWQEYDRGAVVPRRSTYRWERERSSSPGPRAPFTTVGSWAGLVPLGAFLFLLAVTAAYVAIVEVVERRVMTAS